jgi:spermidine synthase
MCRNHLKPGGVMTLWMPLYESNMESAKSLIATFFQVFPNGLIFSNDQHLEGYDAVLLGQVEPARIDLNRLESILSGQGYSSVRDSLIEVGFGATGYEGEQHSIVIDLMSTFAGQASTLTKWTKNAQINRDRNLRLQYLSGMWFNSYLSTTILESILDGYKFPSGVFVGSDDQIENLKRALAMQGRHEK